MKTMAREKRREGAVFWAKVGGFLGRFGAVGSCLLFSVVMGCQPFARFPADVQASVAPRNKMQRMETEHLVLYYPRGFRAETLRAAERLEYCRAELMDRARIKDGPGAGRKSVFVMPNLPFNNAYVEPAIAGREQVAVLPQYSTIDYFVTLGLPPDPGLIGCHELTHDVVMRQMSGFPSGLRYAFGELFSPAIGLEAWFHEGIAVFYETRLLGLGRLNNQYVNGMLAAGVAGRRIDGGLANANHRTPNFGHYLVGAHFVDYLVGLKGEDALWEVVGRQSNELLFPIAVTGRFQKVYGKTLRGLFRDFSAKLAEKYPARLRPDDQRRRTQLGREAGFFVSASGRYAALTYDVDSPPVFVVYEADGTLLHSRHLTDLVLGRRLRAPIVDFMSGLSLTADGKHAYFVAADRGALYFESRLVHVDVERGTLTVLETDIGGPGGAISADGKYYYYVRAEADSYSVFEYNVSTRKSRRLTQPGPRHYHTGPVVSPDGTRLLVTESSAQGIGLALYDVATGKRLRDVPTPGGMTLTGSFADDTRVVYSASDGDRLQVFETDLNGGGIRKLTDAPYLAWEPYVAGSRLVFLNREEWRFTVDEVPYPDTAEVPFQVPFEKKRTESESTDRKSPPGEEPEANPVAPAQEPPESSTEEMPQEPASGLSITTREEQYGAFISVAPLSQAAAEVVPAEGESASKDHQEPELSQVKVISDRPYRPLPGFFRPRAWGPSFETREDLSTLIGAAISFGDDLGYNRWLIKGGYDVKAELPSASFAIVNGMLAPYFLTASVDYIGRSEGTLNDFENAPDERIQIQETLASLSVARTWFGSTTVSVGGRYVDALYTVQATGTSFEALRLAGPNFSFSHVTQERTAYTGPRLGFAISGSATYFPQELSVDEFDLVDAGASVGVTLPLPLSKRHTLSLGASSRALLGAPEAARMLQIGGAADEPPLLSGEPRPDGERIPGQVPPGISFREQLRGFEDLAFFGSQVVDGEAEYTFPFIVDEGSLSTLYLFPSFFFRQMDLDLFFTSASFLDDRQLALAFGTALDFKVNLWVLPLTFTFQQSRRLSHDRDWAFYFTMGVD